MTTSYSEKVLEELIELSKELNVGLFEATGEYCTRYDLDEYEFIKNLDKNAVEQIKTSAINSGAVRKCVETAKPTLF